MELGLDDFDMTPMMLRRMSWDALPCDAVPEIHRRLGLATAGDPDQEDMDHLDSHERLKLVAPLVSTIDFLTPLMAQIISKTILIDVSGDTETTELIERQLNDQNESVIRAALVAVLTQLLDNGVLEYSDKVGKMIGGE